MASIAKYPVRLPSDVSMISINGPPDLQMCNNTSLVNKFKFQTRSYCEPMCDGDKTSSHQFNNTDSEVFVPHCVQSNRSRLILLNQFFIRNICLDLY